MKKRWISLLMAVLLMLEPALGASAAEAELPVRIEVTNAAGEVTDVYTLSYQDDLLKEVSGPEMRMQLSYNDQGRLFTKMSHLNGLEQLEAYEYNQWGQLIHCTNNTGGEEVTYEYDENGRKSKATNSFFGGISEDTFVYDDSGFLTRKDNAIRDEMDSTYITSTDYFCDQQGRITMETSEELSSAYDYDTCAPFVLKTTTNGGGSFCELYLTDAGDIKTFSLTMAIPQEFRHENGTLSQLLGGDEGLTYTFYYAAGSGTVPQRPDWSKDYERWLIEDRKKNTAYLSREELDGTQYYLFFLDDNEIPELLICNPIMAMGWKLLTWNDGIAATLDVSSGDFSYVEKSNYCHSYAGAMGQYLDVIYYLRDGKFQNVASGTKIQQSQEDFENFDYFWNESQTTEELYYAEIDRFLDPDSRISVGDMTPHTYDEILQLLQQAVEEPSPEEDPAAPSVSNQVTITGGSGFREDTVLDVQVITDPSQIPGLNLPQDLEGCEILDIRLQENGQIVEPEGVLELQIPIPQGVSPEQAQVFQILEGGKLKPLSSRVQNGCLIVSTDSLRYFLVGNIPQSLSASQAAPQRHLSGAVWVLLVIIVLLLILSAWMLIPRPKERRKNSGR